MNLQNWGKFENKIPRPSQLCISSGFVKQRFNYFQSIKIFDIVEKTIFLRFLHEDTDKVRKQTRDKPLTD